MLRLLGHVGPTAYLRKIDIKLLCHTARHRAEARSRNRSESCLDSQCGIDAMWRDRCDACSCAARSVVRSRGAGDRSAARRFRTEESLERGSAATPKIRATERTTSQSYRRTPTSIATYSISRNPEITSPPHSPRCELRAAPCFVSSASDSTCREVRSVTSAIRKRIESPHHRDDPPT